MRILAVAVGATLLLPQAALAQALTLQGPYWGDASAWSGGQLPANTDDVAFTAGTVFIATPALAAVQAQARNVEATGRQLVFGQGASLNAVRLQGADLAMTGGLLAIRGARLPTDPDNETNLGSTSIASTGLTASIMTVVGLGTVRFGTTTAVDGTLDLRGQGRFVNPAGSTMTVRNSDAGFDRTGNLALYGEVRFFNDGTIDIQGPSQIADVPSPNSPGTRFVNGVTGAIEASDPLFNVAVLGRRTSINPYVENAGRIGVASGRLTLVNGGTHAGAPAAPAGTSAVLEASGNGVLELWGAHEIADGVVAVTGSGAVELGGFQATSASSLSVGNTATLATSVARFFQSAPMTVQSGGTVLNTGTFYAFEALSIEAGGTFENLGFMQGYGTIENSGGTVTIGGPNALGSLSGEGDYLQSGGTTTIGPSAIMDLTAVAIPGDEGRFQQQDGTTIVDGLLKAGSVEFLAGIVGGSGTIEYTDSVSSAVIFGSGLTVRPGNSPGVLTINGNLEATGAIFDIEIAGRDAGTLFDQLVVNGYANLDGATVNFQFTDGFLPTPGDVFDWLVTSGGTFGLDTATVSFFSDRGTIDGFLDGNGQLFVSAVTPVPVPAAAWGLGSALLALGAAGRRRGRARNPDDSTRTARA